MSTALQTEDLAFESLYRLHRPPVYAYALATMRHSADAEDVTQTTFLNAYCALHRGVAPRDDLQWLLAIARNVCRDRFRDAKRRPKEEPLDDWTLLAQPDQPEFSVSEICKEISDLSPRYRQILLLREFEGRSYAEISAQLGVSEPAVQSLLGRARRALRDELELGMTCSQARRVSLRHLNGVALREERRALQRHLRRCADCATFVGRAPRTPVARMLWLVWVPYRRIMTIIAGTSAPAGSTAGGTGAIAAKLLTVAVVGGAAAGVTAREVADAPTVGHVTRQPAARIGLPHGRHTATPLPATGVTTTWGSQNLAQGRQALTPTSHRATHWLPRLSSSAIQPPLAVPPPVTAHLASGTGAESTPAAPASTETDGSQVAAPSQELPAPNSSVAQAADAPSSSTGGPVPAPSATPPTDAAVTDATAPTAAASGTTGPDAAPTTSTTPATPVVIPPGVTPTPPSPAHGSGNANDNAVGQGGTPPGLVDKPDPAAHGRN